MGFRRNILSRIAVFLLLAVLFGLAAPRNARAVAADNIPHTMNFDGYLTNAAAEPLSGTKDMKFSLLVDATRVWYAEYAIVSVTGGVFAVVLGDPAQGGISLDPSTGTPQASTFLHFPPSVLSTITSASVVTLEIEVYNGTVFEKLSPAYTVSSALFALKADTIDGYDSTQLAKLDGSGNILSNNGTAVIDSTGMWVGPPGITSAMIADRTIASADIDAGAITSYEIADNTIVKADLAANAVTADKHFWLVTVTISGTNIVADCGTGNVAISGGGDCNVPTKAIVKSCPVSALTATACDTTGVFLQYWLISCASSGSNRAWATCMKGA